MKIFISFLVLAFFLSFSQYTVAEAPQRELEDYSVPELLVYYADLYGANKYELLDVARCESGFEPTNKGDNGLANQIMQYHRETFYADAKLMGEDLDYTSTQDNAKLAAWIFANHPERRSAWSTWVALQRGGKYTFYSRLLGKWYTVSCYPQAEKTFNGIL